MVASRAEEAVTMLSRLMPNTGGTSSCRRLLATVVQNIALYGALV